MYAVYQGISFCGSGRKAGSSAGCKIFGECTSAGDYDHIGSLLFEKHKLYDWKQRNSGNIGGRCGSVASFMAAQYFA